MKILAALVVALAAMWGWSVAQAEEARVEGFAFVCETVEGDKVKPKLGDIEGVSYSRPARRARAVPRGYWAEDGAVSCERRLWVRHEELGACRVSAAIPRAGAVVRRALRARAGQVRRSGRGVDRGGQPRCKRAAAPSKGAGGRRVRPGAGGRQVRSEDPASNSGLAEGKRVHRDRIPDSRPAQVNPHADNADCGGWAEVRRAAGRVSGRQTS